MVMATVFWDRVAVMAAAPLSVIVVAAEFMFAKVTEPEGVALHDENVYPLLGVTEIDCPATPASNHVAAEGVVVPEPEGVTANVAWYCVL